MMHDGWRMSVLLVCVCVCVFFPSILDIKFVGRTSRGHTVCIVCNTVCHVCMCKIQPFFGLRGVRELNLHRDK